MSEPLFLSDTELRELTGYALRGKQIDWLKTNRVPFFVNGRGRAKVARSVVVGQLMAQEVDVPKWAPRVLQQA